MLVLEEPDSLRLVTQHDHAKLARDILALWTGDGLPEDPLREDLLLATGNHDAGWRGADAAPILDQSRGWPFDFRSYPEAERQLLWTEAVAELELSRPDPALLILRHAERIHRDRSARATWQPFFDFLAQKRLEIEALCESSSQRLDEMYEFLWLADTCSLGACGVLAPQRIEWRQYEVSLFVDELRLDPFPFAGPLTLRLAHRTIPKRRYESATGLASSLAQTRWRFRSIRIEPGVSP